MPPREGAAEIRRLVAEAEDVTPEPPRLLMRELPAADPFPIDALGDVLGAAAGAIHDCVQAPIAIGGQSVLGAATLAVQGHADVALPIGPGQPKPICRHEIDYITDDRSRGEGISIDTQGSRAGDRSSDCRD